jgi:hypothetical protein
MDLFDDSPLVFEFLDADAAFRDALETAFPDEDIISRSSFSGLEVVSIVGRVGKEFIAKLSAFLVAGKRAEAARKVKIKVGKNEVELSGYTTGDIKDMEETLVRLVREAQSA